MDSLHEKIKTKRKEKGFSQGQLADSIGVDRSQFSKIERGILKPTIDVLVELCSILDVSSDYLIGINGKIDQKETIEIGEALPVYQRKSKTVQKILDQQIVPLYNIEATAGIVSIFNDQKSVPTDHIRIPNLPKSDGAVYVTGDSMYPLLKSGDIVIYKEIQNHDDIFWGEMYLISIQTDSDIYTAVKWIQKSEVNDDHVKLVSQNTHHQPLDVKKDKIVALGLVKASIRFNSMS